ncbi:HsdM family class I SAM-dependent methyltransferase [Pseudohongiella nitratireducens]|uniref:HsdM family class I SAM-dependent methyltransferase n=1 Tax=Pseudohongiella nitratireducens TaxID=1768907 RepID=UPI0030EE33CD|tara:strand:+ start:4559 stop:7420 length:2862 start_codon:yes stop_codon:yes gene_type:complete
MSTLLRALHLAPPTKGKAALSGLVSVNNGQLPPCSIAEKVAQREAVLLEGSKETKNIPIDYIFFRRFADERSSQVTAYVLDNSEEQYTNEHIAELHYRVWLSGNSPLLYVEWPTRVDVLKCAAEPVFWDRRNERPEYRASATLNTVSDISRSLDEVSSRRFSAYRLSDGTFWDDPENSDWACADKAAHKSLIQAVVETDNDLNGAKNSLMRRLLLLFILAKYLEDRGVFPKSWFHEFHNGASNFLEVLGSGKITAVRKMLATLKEKFNGDIFNISSGIEGSFTRDSLTHFTTLLDARTLKRQMHLWKQYSFNYIPVEVLSHLYQHFAQQGKGAVFTPPFVADLMLDHAMPYSKITGRETVFDPTCGSGIFLVGAFRRLIHHWQSHNEWARPSVGQLKKMLKTSIFGAEFDPSAADVAAFNLALAVCDALQPNVIWRHLKFDKLIGENILVGDVFENLEKIQKLAGNGFTTILGNPPFMSKLTKAAVDTRKTEKRGVPIPDNQMSSRIIEEASALLKPQGRLCLIQPSVFLYSANARRFLVDFLSSNTVEMVLDFVSIRHLFEGADPKTVAIIATPKVPNIDHKIIHQTFRRTKSVHERIGFELDHYDHHVVPQDIAEEFPSVWKANLLGGGRLLYLSQKISSYRTLREYWGTQGWSHGEGFIVGKNSRRVQNDWLPGKPFLPTSALEESGVRKDLISVVKEEEFAAARIPARFTAPMFLIRQNETLSTDFWSNGYLTFLQEIMSVNAPESDKRKLRQFAKAFDLNKNIIRAFFLLKSPRALVGRSTSLLKQDIEDIPWPTANGNIDLSWWERTLLDDVLNHMSKLIRVGQNSTILTKAVDDIGLDNYASLFTKMLGSVYRNLRPGKSDCFDGLAYQAFYFGEQCDLDWPDDWSDKLASIVHKSNSAIHTSRVIRFYDENTLIIVKPNRLRHWIPSTAIRDADETLVELQQQGF